MKKSKIIIGAGAAIVVFAVIVVLVFRGKDTQTGTTPTAVPTQTIAPTESVDSIPTPEPTKAPEPTEVPEPTAEPTAEPVATMAPQETLTPVPTVEPTEIPHEHVWVVKETPVTCITDGYTREVCECGAVQNEVITQATGHGNLVYKVVKEPTVDEEGTYEEVCEICGVVVNSGSIAKAEPTAAPTATPEPTPTLTPSPTATMAPQETLTQTATPTPTSTPTPAPTATSTPKPTSTPAPTPAEHVHVWEENVIEATCGESGKSWEECECGAIQNKKTIPKLSEHGDLIYIVEAEPTEEEVGSYYEECSICGEKINRGVLPKLSGDSDSEYDPASDGYTEFVEAWDHEGIHVELWKEPDSRFSVLIFSGSGEVTGATLSSVNGWTTKTEYMQWIRKIHFCEGITVIDKVSISTQRLEEVHFPSTLKEIGSSAFSKSKLKEVILPEGLVKLGRGAFSHIDELEKVVLPSTLQTIEFGVFTLDVQSPFNYENKLKEVTLPKSVKEIGYGAFEYRYDLVLTLEAGIDTSGYEEGWNYDGDDRPLAMITE